MLFLPRSMAAQVRMARNIIGMELMVELECRQRRRAGVSGMKEINICWGVVYPLPPAQPVADARPIGYIKPTHP
jgi:hypothetical protein